MITAHDLTKEYRQGQQIVRALDGVALSVASGEFVLVRGPSGCGKTTLLLILGGLLQPDAGSVRIDTENPYDQPPGLQAAFRAARVGFVFQQFYLIPYLSARENVLCAALGLNHRADEARADELLERFHLAERRQHRPQELSTGEKQRVALARALFNRPVLLLADEPTGNLDEDNAREVVAALREYAHEGHAVMMATHDSRWETSANRSIRMEYGKIVAPGHVGGPSPNPSTGGEGSPHMVSETGDRMPEALP